MINIVDANDWIGIYRDGKLLHQNHDISIEGMCEFIGIDFNITYMDDKIFDEAFPNGRLPNKLSVTLSTIRDVKNKHEKIKNINEAFTIIKSKLNDLSIDELEELERIMIMRGNPTK